MGARHSCASGGASDPAAASSSDDTHAARTATRDQKDAMAMQAAAGIAWGMRELKLGAPAVQRLRHPPAPPVPADASSGGGSSQGSCSSMLGNQRPAAMGPLAANMAAMRQQRAWGPAATHSSCRPSAKPAASSSSNGIDSADGIGPASSHASTQGGTRQRVASHSYWASSSDSTAAGSSARASSCASNGAPRLQHLPTDAKVAELLAASSTVLEKSRQQLAAEWQHYAACSDLVERSRGSAAGASGNLLPNACVPRQLSPMLQKASAAPSLHSQPVGATAGRPPLPPAGAAACAGGPAAAAAQHLAARLMDGAARHAPAAAAGQLAPCARRGRRQTDYGDGCPSAQLAALHAAVLNSRRNTVEDPSPLLTDSADQPPAAAAAANYQAAFMAPNNGAELGSVPPAPHDALQRAFARGQAAVQHGTIASVQGPLRPLLGSQGVLTPFGAYSCSMMGPAAPAVPAALAGLQRCWQPVREVPAALLQPSLADWAAAAPMPAPAGVDYRIRAHLVGGGGQATGRWQLLLHEGPLISVHTVS